jgi:DNA ligase-1
LTAENIYFCFQNLFAQNNKMLAVKFNPKYNVDGWIATEKIDGIRGLWNGRTMRTRSGKIVTLPTRLKRVLPRVPLDGELYFGRNRFSRANRWINAHDDVGRGLKYYVFDVIDKKSPYKERVERAKALVSRIKRRFGRTAPLVAAKPIRVRNQAHLGQLMNRVLEKGGEGLILRDPASMYVTGRSKKMLKLKPVKTMMGVVIGHNLGKTVGSVKIRLSNGVVTSVKGKRRPIGSKIIIEFQELTTKGAPRHPRVRG